MEAELDGQKVVFTVPAVEFGRMGWVLPRLGKRTAERPKTMECIGRGPFIQKDESRLAPSGVWEARGGLWEPSYKSGE